MFLLVVVLAVVGFIYWYYASPRMMMENPADMQQIATTTEQVSNTPDIGPSTDEGLEADLISIDAQLKAVDTQSASVDESFNDKPVAQTE